MAPTLRIYKMYDDIKGLFNGEGTGWLASFGGVAKPLRKLNLMTGTVFMNEWDVAVRGNKVMRVRITFDETKPNREGITYEVIEQSEQVVVWSNDDQPYNENAFEVSVPMRR